MSAPGRPVLARVLGAIADLMSASADQVLQLPACFALGGIIMFRERRESVDAFEVGAALLALGATALLVRFAWRGRARHLTTAHPSARWALAPITWAHFLFDGLWLWLGVAALTSSLSGPGRADGRGRDLGFGLGFLIVTGLLSVVRVVCLVRQSRASRARARA